MNAKMISLRNAELENLRKREKAQAEEARQIAAENANKLTILNDEINNLRKREQ